MTIWKNNDGDVTLRPQLTPRAPTRPPPPTNPDSIPGGQALGLASALHYPDRRPGSLLKALSIACPCALGGPL